MSIIDYNQPNLHAKPLENRTMGDDETLIQLVKIVLGVIGLVILASGIFHLNKNLTTIIKQNGEVIEILRK